MSKLLGWLISVMLELGFRVGDLSSKLFGQRSVLGAPIVFLTIVALLAILLPAVYAIPLIILLILPLWVVVPVLVPVPPFRGPIREMFERSTTRLRAAARPGDTVNRDDLRALFPAGSKVAEAERVLRKEGFRCRAFQDEKYRKVKRRFKICRRCTRFHPLGQFGWEVRLLADQHGTVLSAEAHYYYDGL